MRIYKAILLCVVLLTATSAVAQQPADTTMVNVAFRQVEQQDLLGGVAAINVQELLKKEYYTGSTDGLQSFIGGYNSYSGAVWGQTPLVLVDGVPRDASSVLPSQIESITVMSAASAVVLYGSRASKGVVLITTKTGEKKPLSIDIRANTGLYVPKSYPNYLDAASYMTLYNEARANDGLSPLYSDATIYNTAAGTNPYRYPDQEFFTSDYLRKVYNKTDVTAEVSGGGETAKYYANFSLSYNNTLLRYGESAKDNNLKFNMLANVELKITDWLKATASTGIITDNTRQAISGFWYDTANMRPNWYSPLLPISMIDMDNSELAGIVAGSSNIVAGSYLLGGRSTDTTSSFANMTVGGYQKTKQRNFSFQVALEANLDMVLRGLSFKTMFDIDYWDYYTEAYENAYAVYEPTWGNVNGKDMIIALTQYNLDRQPTTESVGASSMSQTMTFSAQFDYNRQFKHVHNLAATLVGWGYQQQDEADEDADGSAYHRTTNVNLGLDVQYNYARRYYGEVGLALVHSAKLPPGRRNALSPSVTVGWRIANEKFMQKAKNVDELKVTASYTMLHQDLDISDYYLYNSTFNTEAAWFRWKDSSEGGWYYAYLRGANANLRMLTRKEWRLGLSAAFWQHTLSFDFNIFTQDTDGGLISSSSLFPSYYSTGGLVPYTNYNRDRRQGLDVTINFNKRIGKVDVEAGFTAALYKSKAVRRDETVEYDYLRTQGRALDATWGYICEGFLTDEDLAAGYSSSLSSVQAGDLKYKDLNGDGIIDSNDRTVLGHTSSPFLYGAHLTLRWKGFTLFALATGQAGGIGFKNNAYYWVYGDRKYSEVVWGRWTPATAETATYPRLTTTTSDNNFTNSTFWRYSTRRFDLSRVQLTYDMPAQWFAHTLVKGISVYLAGENLCTIAPEREYLEMNVGSAPQCRFYNFGITVKI